MHLYFIYSNTSDNIINVKKKKIKRLSFGDINTQSLVYYKADIRASTYR